MKKAPILFLSILVSCKVSITTHQPLLTRVKPNAQIDSVVVLEASADVKLPDAVVLCGETDIKAPLQQNYTYLRLLEYAKNEAKKLGGNLIKVAYYHGLYGTKYLRSSLKVSIFRVDQNSLATVMAQLASAQRAYRDSIKTMAIIHIMNYNEAPGKTRIYFNDSLVAKIKGWGFDGLNKKRPGIFVFTQGGTLKTDEIAPIDIEMGKEYYIVLYTVLGRREFHYHYKLVDKLHFENKAMLLESIY